jgi:intracellular multiplication protein IcmS
MNINAQLCSLAKIMNANFTLYGKPISHKDVFADTGLLPAISKRADQLCSLCLGYGVGVTFTEVEKSLLGMKVQFDEVTPNILRLVFMCDVVSELMKVAPSAKETPLDELMYD